VRLLITGGAGCLGFNLIEEHLAPGNEILIIDNFATGSREALAASPRLEIVDGTVADRELVDAVFARFAPTHVIHSAASSRVRSIPSRRRGT
jgi:UDP-glucose 4-epimerase